jgi:hypothetical protein
MSTFGVVLLVVVLLLLFGLDAIGGLVIAAAT